jgi:hypothetical protein
MLSEREQQSLEDLKKEIGSLPGTEKELIYGIMDDCEKLDPKKYDM